jgi:hypothetical protein
MKARTCAMALLLGTAVLGVSSAAASSMAPPIVVKPGFTVAPFSGFWAGMPPFASPKFGVINAPFGGPHPPLMFVAELSPAGAQVSIVQPNGWHFPYTVPKFPSGAAGVDIDGPISNSPGMTMGIYGGPPMMYVAEVTAGPNGVDQIFPGGAWMPFGGPLAMPGYAALAIDRTPGWFYGGLMYVSDWGADQSDGILQILPNGAPVPFVPLPGQDPRYMTFDAKGGATGFGPGSLWYSSFSTGAIASVLPNGAPMPPLAVLNPGVEGLSFALGDGCFGKDLYVANLPLGTIDVIDPLGNVTPFASGFPGAAHLLFVNQGPFAINAKPTLYVLDGIDSVWVITPIPQACPADFDGNGAVDGADLAILLGAWGPCFGIPCPPDMDSNSMVDGADSAILLGAWGGCPGC